MTRVPRTEWDRIVAEFNAVFSMSGTVTITDEAVSFTAHQTGLELRRDGTSSSFMPLHRLGARWEEAGFDAIAHTVELTADGLIYTYRLPPELVPSEGSSGS